ncbi:MAG: hypothetical protein NTW48_04220 [Chloroflexi bacterium]|nr:hypothetical protein [Chloroflexota bacterium]
MATLAVGNLRIADSLASALTVDMVAAVVPQAVVYTVLALAVTRLKNIYRKDMDLSHVEYPCHIAGIYTTAASQPPLTPITYVYDYYTPTHTRKEYPLSPF